MISCKSCLGAVGSGDPSTTPNSVILPHKSPNSGSCVVISRVSVVSSVPFIPVVGDRGELGHTFVGKDNYSSR